ncbi:MAG: hypothetical protein IAE87_14260 [Rhodobacteraceae bacterium]|nr:hypothetical protein [Paracoccaceae bacterium]
MSLPKPVPLPSLTPAQAAVPQIARQADEYAMLRRVDLRRLSAIDQMYAYYGADLA